LNDEFVRGFIAETLTEHGYEVLVTPGPARGARARRLTRRRIDVVVTDVVMSHTAETMRGRNLPAGSALLQKPFEDIALLKTIRALLEPESQTSTRVDSGLVSDESLRRSHRCLSGKGFWFRRRREMQLAREMLHRFLVLGHGQRWLCQRRCVCCA
jgi:DNA-binding response OmpR family regulator